MREQGHTAHQGHASMQAGVLVMQAWRCARICWVAEEKVGRGGHRSNRAGDKTGRVMSLPRALATPGGHTFWGEGWAVGHSLEEVGSPFKRADLCVETGAQCGAREAGPCHAGKCRDMQVHVMLNSGRHAVL